MSSRGRAVFAPGRGRHGGAMWVVGLIAAAMVPLGSVPSQALPGARCPAWRVVPSPALLDGYLNGVAGTSSTDGWAVGTYFGVAPPIILHWDGTSWTQFPQTHKGYVLNEVDAVSPTDAWAVGSGYPTGPLALHWDGVSWTRIPSPAPGREHIAYDVEAVSSDDVWLVGGYVGGQGLQGLTMHWDGTTWTAVPAEPALYGSTFHALAAVSSDDVWAVGYQGTPVLGDYDPIIEHWDGTRWSIVPAAPPPSGDDNQFYEVAAVSSDDVWAVGFYASPELAQPLIEHWDGTAWSLAEVPHLDDGNDLSGVAAVSSDDVWAVGNTFQIASRPLTLHWDGTVWTQVQARAPSNNAAFGAVAVLSPGNVWAVGSAFDYSGNAFRPLTERSRGPCLARAPGAALPDTPPPLVCSSPPGGEAYRGARSLRQLCGQVAVRGDHPDHHGPGHGWNPGRPAGRRAGLPPQLDTSP